MEEGILFISMRLVISLKIYMFSTGCFCFTLYFGDKITMNCVLQ